MSASFDYARRCLREHFGHPDFRPAQAPVIRSVLAGRDTLAVLPTGGGKSVCFQVPAMVLGGLTLVVSPLIALMQDQVAAAVARGIPAAALNSGVPQDERGNIRRALDEGSLRLLYVSPERLARLAPELQARGVRPALLAVDEAHCIAEWGHDFRPQYRTLGAARYRLGSPPTVALTGSATPDVRQDIVRTLRFRSGRYAEHLGSFDRANLWFGVMRVGSERERLAALVRLLADDDSMVIVYTPTRSVTEAVARALVQAGHRAAPYHAGLPPERRRHGLTAFLEDRVDVIVATCAFGMGIDKPEVRMVVHWTLPPTPEAYYQEAGRAGRDGAPARCVLLWRKGDAALHRRQLEVTFPPRPLLEQIWRESSGCHGIPANVHASAERLRLELRPERGPVDWSVVLERRRRAETRIAAIEAYASGRQCRRRTLLAYFGESLEQCAGCDRCRHRRVTTPANPAVAARLARLRAAVAECRGAWGAALLEPEVLLSLARHPPADVGGLADVPGVGPALAGRWGRPILAALGRVSQRLPPVGPRHLALASWRRAAARAAGVPEYRILGDAALERLAHTTSDVADPLAGLPALGPRARAKYGDELRRLVAAYPSDRYLLPMDQGDAEILERIQGGERVFRPGADELARHTFEVLVAQLRDLHQRGLIDMPGRGRGGAGDEDSGASAVVGPCHVTDAGRAALDERRRSDRRSGERRAADRRSGAAPTLSLPDTERRQGDRRRRDRRG